MKSAAESTCVAIDMAVSSGCSPSCAPDASACIRSCPMGKNSFRSAKVQRRLPSAVSAENVSLPKLESLAAAFSGHERFVPTASKVSSPADETKKVKSTIRRNSSVSGRQKFQRRNESRCKRKKGDRSLRFVFEQSSSGVAFVGRSGLDVTEHLFHAFVPGLPHDFVEPAAFARGRAREPDP